MAIGKKQLCDVCLGSFHEGDLTRASGKHLCAQCARLQGVEVRVAPRVVIRRPGAESGDLRRPGAERGVARRRGPGRGGESGAAKVRRGAATDTGVLGAFGAEVVRCLGDDDLQGFAALFLTEGELRAIVGRAEAGQHVKLVHGRIARDFHSKRSFYARQAGDLAFVDAQAGKSVRIAGEVVELRDVEIRFRVGTLPRRLLIRRVFRVHGKCRLEFFE
jgi:hypothetical protein